MFLFMLSKVEIGAHRKKIDPHGHQIPCDDRPGVDQETVIDPDDLKRAHNTRHSRIHALAGMSPEHLDQVWYGGKGGSEAGYETDDLFQ